MKNGVRFFFAMVVLATVPVLTVCAITRTSEADTKENDTKLEIQIGEKNFTAVLYDNESTAAFVQKLPLTLDMSELNGNEKYFFLTDRLPTNSQRIGSIKTGDLMLYGSNCLVFFYEIFSTSYSYTKLGYVTDATGLARALGSGSVKVSFSVAQ